MFGNDNKGFGGTTGLGTSGGLFNSAQSFNSGNTASSSASIFGGGNVGEFGSTINSFNPSSGTTFGKPAEQSGTSNIFGMGQTQNNPIFGGPPSFGNKTSNIFGQQQQQTETSSNIFGQSQSNFCVDATQPQPSFFGTNATTTNQNIFGGSDNLAITNQQSVFGGTTQGNIFGSQQSSVFGGDAQQSTFGSSVPTTSTHQTFSISNTNQPVNAFGSFGFKNDIVQAQPPPPPPPFSSVTTQSQPSFGDSETTNVFQTQTNTTVPSTSSVPTKSVNESTIYSKIENLTQEEIDCFKATTFELGKIPTVPPPREMCV